MELKDQVCSIELARKLKELGVAQNSIFVWEYVNDTCYGLKFVPYAVVPNNFNNVELYSAFTSAELGEFLPDWQESVKRASEDWVCIIRYTYLENDINDHAFAKTEADARAKMVIYLIEKSRHQEIKIPIHQDVKI